MPETVERRQGIRVPIHIPLKFNLRPNKEDYVRTLTSSVSLFPDDDQALELNRKDPLEAFVLRMDIKLNYIIELLSSEINGKKYTYKATIDDISESGLKMTTSAQVENDSILELGLTIPTEPHRTLDVLALVNSTKPKTGLKDPDNADPRSEVSLTFIDIVAEDKESIVHYIFQMQRQVIRDRKENENQD